MWSFSCVSVDVLLQTKWVAERLVAHVTLPLAAAHVWTDPFDVPSQVA